MAKVLRFIKDDPHTGFQRGDVMSFDDGDRAGTLALINGVAELETAASVTAPSRAGTFNRLATGTVPPIAGDTDGS